MDGTLVGILGIIILMAVLFFLGTPVGFAMAIVGFAGFCYFSNVHAGLSMLSSVLWPTFSNAGLTVIPLFILMGQVAFHSGVNEKLYRTAHCWVGHIRGGIAMATVLACAAFAAICGSNAATAATMTTVALPEMNKYKYEPMLSTSAIASGSTLGVVIPPSVVLIVIGLNTQQSIPDLFFGGISAGIILSIALAVTVYLLCIRNPAWGPVSEIATWGQRFRSLFGTIDMVILFGVVIGGLAAGFFTPLEAGAVGSFFAVVLSAVQGKLSWKVLITSIMETIRISCMVIIIVAGAVIFGKFLAVTRIPFDIADWVASLPIPGVAILMVIFGIYIIGGAVMDALALLLITLPIFFPVAKELGYDPIWFGVTITVVTTLGAITPPVGATTYVVAGMAPEVPMQKIFKGVLFFLPAYVVTILLLTAFPWLVNDPFKYIKVLFG
jgi:C4-dicarboxylate transporter DctM subunit